MASSARIHPAAVARAIVGVSLLVWPERVLDAVGGEPADRRWVLAARVLGGRHLIEAVAVNLEPEPATAVAGSAVDAIHACTAGALALLDRERRGVLAVNAVAATAFAIAGAHHARVLARGR